MGVLAASARWSRVSDSEAAEAAGDGADGDPDEYDVFLEAKDDFLASVEEIDEEDPEADIRLIKARNEMFRKVAAVGPQEAIKRQLFQLAKREIPFITSIKRVEKDYTKIAGDVGGPDRPHITSLLRDEVATIEKLAAGETGSEAKYRFNFENGRSLVVEHATLYSPTAMRRAYDAVFDVLPVYDGDEEDGYDVEWEDLIHELKQDRLVVKEDHVGPRTAAIQSLRNTVADSPAYLSPARAASRNGVYLPVDPDDLEENEAGELVAPEADRVLVPSAEITAVCDDQDISIESLRIEMDNRDLRTGTSEELRIGGGRKEYFWPLPRGDGEREFREKMIEYEPEADSGDEGDSEEA